MSPGLAAVATGFRSFARYLGGVLGADAYAKYLEHYHAAGHGEPPLTEREFWRDRTDRQDSNPQGRCC
ncbi:YbdD/YjiX family protein [Pseudarthrobacter cellobiosi]|uniref:YbdD/YjiX family protein n=1 Tax=Pseudarthrobacter cellobiosi TaxID=2953654 RepID=UPI00208E612D|nr:YbdD/YjiX family protein [Pseudarthrobacter sp. HLT1-5]MCO4254348.1 YbdD/YjiX family protein [Pseudarthrobacter sp. HLT1-5]